MVLARVFVAMPVLLPPPPIASSEWSSDAHGEKRETTAKLLGLINIFRSNILLDQYGILAKPVDFVNAYEAPIQLCVMAGTEKQGG